MSNTWDGKSRLENAVAPVPSSPVEMFATGVSRSSFQSKFVSPGLESIEASSENQQLARPALVLGRSCLRLGCAPVEYEYCTGLSIL